ncbi:MAG: hypothetical protein CMC97_04915 [Flavobacteriales bacterium]|nr:hypothetical protein [Flavobacteriales bacterium]
MSHAFTYQAPYGTFHFSEGLLTVELAEDLIVDLPLMQRVSAQRLELLGDREVAELIVIPRAHLLLDRAALTWMAQASSLSGVHHRAIVVPAHLLVWRDRLYQMISRLRPNVRVFRNRRVAKAWLQDRAGTFTPRTAERTEASLEMGVEVSG